MQKEKESKTIKRVVMIVLLIAAASMFYFYVIFMPRLHREDAQAKLQLEAARMAQERTLFLEVLEQKRKLLNACLDNAYSDYKNEIQSSCHSLGEKKDCILPTPILNSCNDNYQEIKNLCYDRFPIEMPEKNSDK
ncbi:hypothetical protein ACFL38_00100 [Candidatus Omnitrophota bacterium]